MRQTENEISVDFTAWAALTDTYATQLGELANGDTTARLRLGATYRALEHCRVLAQAFASGAWH